MTTKSKKAKKSSKKSAAKKAPPRKSASSYLAFATNSKKEADERVSAFFDSPIAATEKEESLDRVLKVFSNKDEPVSVRLAALQTIQAASFSSPAFESIRSDYIAALRQATGDPDEEVRTRSFGILAREQDGYAQKKLLEGLQKPDKALLPPEKALQLLSYDVHADAYSAARDIVKEPPNTAAKREALRLLAADASAAPIFEKVLRDKEEDPDLRQISAAALHAIKPDKMQEHAREILMDKTEQDAIQATSLTALTQFADADEMAGDAALLKRVDKLKDEGPAKVKQVAKRFWKKYGTEK